MDDRQFIEMADELRKIKRELENLKIRESANMSSWQPIGAAATYVSATSFTLAGDHTAYLKIGTKIRLVNSTTKYGYVLSSSYSSPNTTVNLVPNSSYPLVSGAITNVNISYAEPPDFPGGLLYTPTYGGFSVDPVMSCRFSISGKTCTVLVGLSGAAGTSNANTFTITPPVNPSNTNPVVYFPARVQDNDVILPTPGIARAVAGGNIHVFADYSGRAWTASGGKAAWFALYYEI